MTTEKTSSPRRSGADWFGLIAFAALVICSAVLVVRLISTKFLPTGQLLLAVGALLVLSGLHGWVQLPHREKTGGKIACGIVAASIRHDPNVRFLDTLDAAKAA